MNKQMKNVLLAGIIILLLSACGQAGTESAPEIIVTDTESPTNIPTAIPPTGLAPEKFRDYIGLTYPPLPTEFSQVFSMIIWDSNDYGLSMVADGENKMLWLVKMSNGNASGETSWEVKDILDLSNMEAGLILIPDGCSLNGKVDNEIFVVSGNNGIRLAWRASTSLDIFQLISTSGIVCNSDKGVSI